MNAASHVRDLRRSVEFVRHVPLSKIARRLELVVRRKLRDRMPPATDAAPVPQRAEAPPQPILPPRVSLAPERLDDEIAFTFLNRRISMPGGAIDWLAPGPGPGNQLWRMNLHYMEYLESVDDDAWCAYVEDWIDKNPANRPGVWKDSWNSYALSLRVVVWLQELARRKASLSDEVVRKVEASAVAQIRFLVRNLETDLGGNHLVKNIKALIWASAFFSGQEAEQWRRLGGQLLQRELAEQVLPDGVHYERSPSYHVQVFADLLECRHALGADLTGGGLDDALYRMAQAVADLQHPDGLVAQFNDAGLNMSYPPGAALAAYAGILGKEVTPRSAFAFADAGYYGMRSRRRYLVIDCGRIAPDDLPAHGHGDILSFELSVGGKRVIVDQGVYEYVAGERRQQSRAAAAHNTLSFDDADQAEFYGAFRCGRRPNVRVETWQPDASGNGFVLEGSHDGFSHLPGRPQHVRRFEVSGNRIVIDDHIRGQCDRPGRIGLLLHPDVDVALDGNTAVMRIEGAVIRMTSGAPVEMEPAVWWPDMGHEVATQRLVVPLASGETALTTCLDMQPEASDA